MFESVNHFVHKYDSVFESVNVLVLEPLNHFVHEQVSMFDSDSEFLQLNKHK